MTDKIDEFIKETLLRDKELLVSIFKEITTKYPDETIRQHAIRAAIMQFEAQYPKVMDEFDHAMQKKKELAKNEYASHDDIDIRAEFAIPDGLETRIKLVFDKLGQTIIFLSDEAEKEYKEKEWFYRNFKRFVVPAKF